MIRAPSRHCFRTFVLSFLFILSSEPVVAQQPFQDIPLADYVSGWVIVVLVFGSGLLLFTPEWTARTTARIHESPISMFLYGLGIYLVIILACGILIAFFGLLGTLIAAPFLFVLVLVSQFAYLSLGTAITENRVIVLLIAMGTAAFVGAVPVLGGLLGSVLSCLGLGAAYHDNGDTNGSGV